MLRDGVSKIDVQGAQASDTGTGNTAVVSGIVDTQGARSVTFLIFTGALTDADATFAVTMDEGDAANLSDAAAVAAADLVGTYALAGFDFSMDNKGRKIGYKGTKRYVRLTVTPSANTGAIPIGVGAVIEKFVRPTANPPA